MLGCEVDKPLKILIKSLNVAQYIKLDIQNIEALRKDDHMYEQTYLQCFLERVFQAIQVSTLYQYLDNLWMVGSPLKKSSPREKEKK